MKVHTASERFEIVHVDYPIDGDEPFFFVQDHENYRPHHTRYETREQAEVALRRAANVVDVKQPVYYFGCLDQIGHFLHKPGGSRWRKLGEQEEGMPFRSLDGPFTAKTTRAQGAALIHHVDGWTVLDIHDRTVDSRGNSHSAFVFHGEVSLSAMLKLARRDWPDILDRIGPITLVEPALTGV